MCNLCFRFSKCCLNCSYPVTVISQITQVYHLSDILECFCMPIIIRTGSQVTGKRSPFPFRPCQQKHYHSYRISQFSTPDIGSLHSSTCNPHSWICYEGHYFVPEAGRSWEKFTRCNLWYFEAYSLLPRKLAVNLPRATVKHTSVPSWTS